MSIPAFLPSPRYVLAMDTSGAVPLFRLCEEAGVRCRASGAWVQRPIVVIPGEEWGIEAMPGPRAPVRVTVPGKTAQARARNALGALAYSTLFDGVARASIAQAPWSKIAAPRGRPRQPRPLDNATRQARWRARQGRA